MWKPKNSLTETPRMPSRSTKTWDPWDPCMVYIYIPGTQMSLVLIGKDILLEAKQRTNGFQVYTFVIYVCLHDQLIFMGKYSIHGSYGIQRDVEKEGKFSDSDITHSFPWD